MTLRDCTRVGSSRLLPLMRWGPHHPNASCVACARAPACELKRAARVLTLHFRMGVSCCFRNCFARALVRAGCAVLVCSLCAFGGAVRVCTTITQSYCAPLYAYRTRRRIAQPQRRSRLVCMRLRLAINSCFVCLRHFCTDGSLRAHAVTSSHGTTCRRHTAGPSGATTFVRRLRTSATFVGCAHRVHTWP
jgi:hypothetical protein